MNVIKIYFLNLQGLVCRLFILIMLLNLFGEGFVIHTYIYFFRRPAVLLRVSRYKAIVRQLTDLVKLLSIYSLILGIALHVYTW